MQPYGDESLEPIELGGSVFVRANKVLWRATEEYGLERFRFENKEDEMGIWDGQKFVLTVSRRVLSSITYVDTGLSPRWAVVDSIADGGPLSRYC